MQQLPEVAVVIPCYGYARFLPQAVQSVVAQTYPRIHCIIVDPQSPDETTPVARDLIRSFPQRRLELLEQENRGLSASRNAGFERSQASLLLPLDADDCLHPTAIEKMVAAFEPGGVSVAHPAGREFGKTSAFMPAVPIQANEQRHRNRLPYCSMVARTAWAGAGGYDETMRSGYEDWDFWLKLIDRGARFVPVTDELFYYRKHSSTMLDAARSQDLDLRARLILNHPNLYAAADVDLARRISQLTGRDPDPALRMQIVRFYVQAGCPAGAIQHADILLQTCGHELDVHSRAALHFAKGYGHLAQTELDLALAALREAVELHPSQASYHRALAIGLLNVGDEDTAFEHLQAALHLDPGCEETHEVLNSLHRLLPG